MTAERVLLITTGGTIGSLPSGQGFAPFIGSGHSLAGQLDDDAISVDELFAQPSGGIGLDHMAAVNERVEAAMDQGFAAVVVTHGTDTLAETAFVLRLLRAESRFPVVLTGAMRSPGLLGSDALRNLADAVTVARSGRDFGTSVLVAFDGVIFSGLRAAKVSSTAGSAFGQTTGGPLGRVVEDRVFVDAKEAFSGLPIALDAHITGQVALIGAWPGDDGAALTASAANASGVVIAGLGGGHVPPQMMNAIADVALTTPLMVTTGTPAGSALRATYGYPGSERALAAAGAITGWSLGARKAVLALALCLGQTEDRAVLKSLLEDDMGGGQLC